MQELVESFQKSRQGLQIQCGLRGVVGRADDDRAVERLPLTNDDKVRDARRFCGQKLRAEFGRVERLQNGNMRAAQQVAHREALELGAQPELDKIDARRRPGRRRRE